MQQEMDRSKKHKATKKMHIITCTRDSQKVRGHSRFRSYLLNAFKSYFIFIKSCFHSLNNANIKKISAVVLKITELECTWVSLSVPRQF